MNDFGVCEEGKCQYVIFVNLEDAERWKRQVKFFFSLAKLTSNLNVGNNRKGERIFGF